MPVYFAPRSRLCQSWWNKIQDIIIMHNFLLKDTSTSCCTLGFYPPLKTLCDLWTIAYLGKYSPFSVQTLWWERVLCLAGVFAVRGAPSQPIGVQRGRCQLTFCCHVHFPRRTSSKTHKTRSRLITCFTWTFTLAFISLTSDPWTRILKNMHTFSVKAVTLKSLTSDLWAMEGLKGHN